MPAARRIELGWLAYAVGWIALAVLWSLASALSSGLSPRVTLPFGLPTTQIFFDGTRISPILRRDADHTGVTIRIT